MKIETNQIELFYEKSGNGLPLILLHGNGEDHHIFDALSLKLQNNFTLYAIDSRNHGESSKTDCYSYEKMAEDIYTFICALHLKNVNILGFSDGAIISLILALKHQDILLKMVLLGINLKPEDFTAENYQFIQNTYAKTKDPLYKLMLEQPNIELDDVKKINLPTLIVGAEHDLFKPECFIHLADAIPHARLMIMKGHEHDSYIVNKDTLYSDLIDFFVH